MTYDCDVLVIGSGAGGATLAYACARAGKNVLLLERGSHYVVGPDSGDDDSRGHGPVRHAQDWHDERAMLIDKKPYDDRPIEVNGAEKRLYIGGVVGGGTALYGAALLRPSAEDFHPGRHYGQRIPRAIWDWPVQYETLAPYYARAERLFGVSGCGDEDFGPLRKPSDGYAGELLPLHPMNQRLMEATRADGLRPFRLPLAIDSERCLRCHACAGYVCPTGARRSSGQLVAQAATEGLSLKLLTGVEVEQLSLEATGNACGVTAVDRATGRRDLYRARRYVLAAGAIASPLLLMKSGAAGELIGRNYMAHLSPIVAGIFARPTQAETAFVKQVGFADYYLGAEGYAHKMGLVQSLPVPGPLMLAKSAPGFLPARALRFLRRRMLPLVGIVEDLPDPENRVSWSPSGTPRLRHRFGSYDLERGRQLSRRIARILKRAGARLCLSSGFASDEHVAHQCGTLRFGTDPAHAVLGPDCRMFDHPNVFVADGSFMPTSLGIGPALTIIANALRVAEVVCAEV
jgi:choline dehydrogenase-like flavoprotein